MTLSYTVRTISDRKPFVGEFWGGGDRTPFREATWAATQTLLERELRMIDAVRVVIEVDVKERDIRADGQLRADASVARTSPAARVAFDSPKGPMQFATDRYGWDYYDRPRAQGWQDNVRAIALGLEALRKVERYGITRGSEQYRGFLQLEAGGGIAATSMTTDRAVQILRDESRLPMPATLALEVVLREARRLSHPDHNNGDRSAWNAVDEAKQVLIRAGRLS